MHCRSNRITLVAGMKLALAKAIRPLSQAHHALLAVTGIAIAATAAADSPFPAAIDLATLRSGDGSEGLVIEGARPFDGASTLGEGGDLNGDGIDDILIGAGNVNLNGRERAGVVYVVFGREDFEPQVSLGSLLPQNGGDGSAGLVVLGAQSGDNAVLASALPDFNGDGFTDLAISAAFATRGDKDLVGEAYVLFGGSTYPPLVDLRDALRPEGDGRLPGVVLRGIDADDLAAQQIASAGDVNGDGLSDLLLTAPNADVLGVDNTGEAYVVFASTEAFPPTLPLASLTPAGGGDGSRGFVGFGPTFFNGLLGSSAARLGDINHDGIDDFALRGVESWTTVVFGTAADLAPLVSFTNLLPGFGGDGSEGFFVRDVYTTERLSDISAAGDFNGDGIDDLLIAEGTQGDGAGAGLAHVVFGRADGFAPVLGLASLLPDLGGDGSAGVTFQGPDRGASTGAGIGDVNCDGVDDIVIAASGEAYLVFGNRDGFAPLEILTDLRPGAGGDGSRGVVLSATGDSGFVLTVVRAGDVNGDGVSDVVLSGSSSDALQSAGMTYVLFGRCAER